MMAVNTVADRVSPVDVTAGRRQRTEPVKYFAVLGAFCLLLQSYVYFRWLASGNAKPTAKGSDAVPGWMSFAVQSSQWVSILLLFVCFYFFVVRPIRRDGKIGLYGLLIPAVIASYWLNFASNYFNHIYTANAAFYNFGSWYSYIPGWISPRGNHIVEPLLFTVPSYIWAGVAPAILCAAMMRRAKARWPKLGAFRLLSIALAVAFALDLVIEPLFPRLGLYVFSGTIPSLTLFKGHYYQFPVYEPLFAGLYLVVFSALIYFRDDRGNTFVERGIDRLVVSPRRATGLRFLALTGFANLALLGYSFIFGLISLFPSFSWASDTVDNRSYLRDQLCGAGTTYACPNGEVPIPRRGGAHVDPDGRLVVPEDAKEPWVRSR